MKKFFDFKKEENFEAFSDFVDSGSEHLTGLSTLYSPEPEVDCEPSAEPLQSIVINDIAHIMLEMGRINEEQLENLRREQTDNGVTDIEKIMLQQGLVNDEDILIAKAKLYGFEFRDIEPEEVDRNAFEKLDLDYIRTNHIMPIACQDDILTLASSDPANVFAVDDIKRRTQMNVNIVVCNEKAIEKVCEAFDDTEFDYCVDDIINDMTEVEVVQNDVQEIEDLEKIAGESPVIKFVNYMISNAIHESASDIHIEPGKKQTQIRYRIDGILFDSLTPPAKMHPAIVSRLKIMSNLDISERRLPQDGKIAVIVGGRGIDLRVSMLPTSHGEKVVVRVLDSKSIMLGLDNSGMQPEVMNAFRQQIKLPHGIVLVTGPTGSGKSTTLYSAMGEMDGKTLNLSTVEDPVEYELDFASQVNVNEKIGLTFASALRSLLRQDPDILMVGEIRDSETAQIAVQAALTGHLVFSTLHTNDAPSSVTRLVNIGIDPYLIAASLNAVLAQRLVRTICPNCKEHYEISDSFRQHAEQAGIDPSTLFHGVGCDNCRQSGYSGRTGIYELLLIDANFRNVINTDSTVDNMKRTFAQSGQMPMYHDGIEKVRHGLTTFEEVLRVTEASNFNPQENSNENMG